jgi:hypothetical protein
MAVVQNAVTFGNVNEAQFRADFPEFANPVTYPPTTINWHLNLASLTFTSVWDQTVGAGGLSVQDSAVELFIGHFLTLEKMAMDQALRGGPVGIQKGPISSSGAGPINQSYAVSEVVEPNAGHWNYTTFGIRLKRLISYYGAGPFQANIGASPTPFSIAALGAFAGPWPWPIPGGFGFTS